jgi:hypothetical protein
MLRAMNPPTPFRIVLLPFDLVDETRRMSTDRLGHRLTPRLNDDPNNPCRFTLRQLRSGEEFLLMSYSPFRRDHPHRETGPIFIARHGGNGCADVHRRPPELDPPRLVLRVCNAAENSPTPGVPHPIPRRSSAHSWPIPPSIASTSAR